ncbi:MAG: DNA polymerase III subunit alpha, partial [Chloroflexota bacterium]
MSEFAHLHLHTESSLLDGMGRTAEYVARARERGIHHLAITDHGVMYGAMEFHKELTRAGLHPIVGIEAYLAEGSAAARERRSYHLLLLAENETGYRNLLRLSSRAMLEGYYYRPRIDLDMLAEHSAGIIGTSACLGGPVANNFLHGEPARARDYAGKLAEILGPDRFYIELQDHGIPEQAQVNRELVPLARSLGLPLVATNDVHYCEQEDSTAQDLLVCIQTNTTIHDEKRLKSGSDQLYLKSAAEMGRLFGEVPEGLSNTIRIAEMCSLDLGFKGYHLPEFPVPDGLSPEDYLEQLCREGVRRKYGSDGGEVGERLAYELGVIRSMGFTHYFLVVWDFVRFARERGILVGPGRGSAAGSIVTYALDITALDPLRYGLIFERFLNPSRISMPDIDIDFADDRRHEVIDYVVRKYGEDRVAQIVTFGTLAAKAAVRDVGRAMGRSFAETDRVAKLIPVGPGITIDSAMDKVPELKSLYEGDATVRELVDAARKVEGIARHASTHAAGVVISRDPLVEHVPVQRAGGKSEGEVTTQYPMGELEDLGLLKMDFLGLRTLTVLGKAVALLNARGVELTLESIPLDDVAAYEALCRGETVGIFQLEGGMTTRMTVDVSPRCFEDLIALMALIRPGPMEMAPDYISRKHGRTPIVYMHPDMEPILAETYGVALYQEQVIRIANSLAGFSMAEGDGLRKAMGKKLPEEMAKYRDRFVSGSADRGIARGLARDVFDMIERFAGYGFNKAHSAAYAVIAAQTAFLKANYPVEFMAALLSSEIGNTDKLVSCAAECRRAGIPVLPPDVNRSGVEFTVEETAGGAPGVRWGLSAVKNAGDAAVRSIIEARDALPDRAFANLDEFCEEVDWASVNKRVVESLAKCGALDGFGPRGSVIAALEAAVGAGQRRQKASSRGQISLFGGESERAAASPLPPSTVSGRELLAWEKELLGLYMSDHPLGHVWGPGAATPRDLVPVIDLERRAGGAPVRLVVMVTSLRRISTRNNRTMAVAEVEDLTGSAELVLFPDAWDRFGPAVHPDAILAVTAKVERRNDALQLVCEFLTADLPAGEVPRAPARTVHVRLAASEDQWEDVSAMNRVAAALVDFEGEDRLVLHVPTAQGMVRLQSRSRRVHWCDELAAALAEIPGVVSVLLEEPARTPDAAAAAAASCGAQSAAPGRAGRAPGPGATPGVSPGPAAAPAGGRSPRGGCAGGAGRGRAAGARGG